MLKLVNRASVIPEEIKNWIHFLRINLRQNIAVVIIEPMRHPK